MKKALMFVSLILFSVIFLSLIIAQEDILIKSDIKHWVDGEIVLKFIDSQENSCMLNRDDPECKSYSANYEYVFDSSLSTKVTIEDNSKDIENSQFLDWAKAAKDDTEDMNYFRESTFQGFQRNNTNAYTWLLKSSLVSGTFWYSGDKVVLIEGEGSAAESVIFAYLKKYPSDLSFCVNGCKLENKCVSMGYRNSGQYCSIEGNFVSQLETDFQCNNNFECSSNLCIDNKCIEAGLFTKIVYWFKNFFS